MRALTKQSFLLLLIVSIILNLPHAKAQGELDEFLRAGLGDANKLTTGYLGPLMEAAGVGLANGWYNTAKPHKTAGFDLTLSVNSVYIPESRKFYDLLALDLQSIEPVGNSEAPTFFGPDTAPEYRLLDDPSITFSGPPGIDMQKNLGVNFVPIPTLNLGIGIVKNTDLRLRYVPGSIVNSEDFSFNMFGVGVMHDVKQHIPGIKLLPFDLSFFAAYTRSNMSFALGGEIPGSDQRAEINFNSITIQGLVSKQISVLTGYAGIGYNIVRSNFGMFGEYEIDSNTFVDPISFDATASGLRATAGMRLKLAILTLHADYTVQQFNVLTVGLGFSVR
ncbi:MAG TPA: hypothetical protein PKC24_05635 [Cyclobacteriaceae bacterium]|nr:hypothetical protein [Cyclobacteriaceae bacterium]